jgi:hypothetical protein
VVSKTLRTRLKQLNRLQKISRKLGSKSKKKFLSHSKRQIIKQISQINQQNLKPRSNKKPRLLHPSKRKNSKLHLLPPLWTRIVKRKSWMSWLNKLIS